MAFRKLFFALAFLSVGAAMAGVNVNNGNFYVAYRDFQIASAGVNFEVTRTYNSRSNYVRGFFGVGWASDLEGYLVFSDKAIFYHEGGGGNILTFSPAEKGAWANSNSGLQKIKKVKSGYLLTASSGKEMLFGANGLLERVNDKNKNYHSYKYENGLLVEVKDNFNNQIKFTWKEFGKFPRIVAVDSGDLKARYTYNPNGSLLKAVGSDGMAFDYTYDDEYNLLKISYADGSSKEMAYNKTRDWITSFKERDGTRFSYDYISDSLDPESKFGTTVTRKSPDNKEAELSRFWYEFRKKSDGSKYNYKAVTLIRGNVTENIFTECCGTPLVISQWAATDEQLKAKDQSWTLASGQKRVTQFEYFPDGLLKKKVTPDGMVTQLTYNPKFRKVAKVIRAGREVQYNYDPRGNLAWAYDKAENRRLDLQYDLEGRINTVVEKRIAGASKEERQIFFRYNAEGRPIEIKEKSSGGKDGILKLSYLPDGSLSGVLNSNGRTVASEQEVAAAQRIAITFQNLIEIVQPAGVSLTPEG